VARQGCSSADHGNSRSREYQETIGRLSWRPLSLLCRQLRRLRRWGRNNQLQFLLAASPQPAFFCRLLGRATGLLAAASFAFLPGIGSNISVCPAIRFRPFFAEAPDRFSSAILRRRASMRFTTFCGRRFVWSYGTATISTSDGSLRRLPAQIL